jgi:hypothetical protein
VWFWTRDPPMAPPAAVMVVAAVALLTMRALLVSWMDDRAEMASWPIVLLLAIVMACLA